MDDRIYHEMGQILFDIAPQGAREIIVDAEITPENDHCKLLFDFVDEAGKTQWFLPPSGQVDSDIFDLLVQLKQFFATHDLFPEGQQWHGCTIKLLMEKPNIKFDFKYDQP
jgi:hypothetical protein